MPARRLLLLAAALAACTRAPAPAPAPTRPLGADARVAVLPFRVGGGFGPGAVFEPEPRGASEVEGDAGEAVARLLATRLGEGGVPVVNPDVVLGATSLAGASAPYDPRLAARVAERVGARYAVLGVLRRFTEREGSAWAAVAPASVAYDAALVRAADAVVVRLDRYDHTQQPLSDNLLQLPQFLQGGGRFVTRDQLLGEGLSATAGRFAQALAAGAPGAVAAPGR